MSTHYWPKTYTLILINVLVCEKKKMKEKKLRGFEQCTTNATLEVIFFA